MCGRYRRRSDKQRIAEAFEAGMGLEDVYPEPEEDIAPGSMQPVVSVNLDGERQLELMRWGFRLPIHDRMTTFLEPRDYEEYLAPAERAPVHLLRILPAEEMRATLVEKSDITNKQVMLFDSQ